MHSLYRLQRNRATEIIDQRERAPDAPNVEVTNNNGGWRLMGSVADDALRGVARFRCVPGFACVLAYVAIAGPAPPRAAASGSVLAVPHNAKLPLDPYRISIYSA